MSEYDNTNSGALFKNDKKASEKHPDYKGSINVDGREFWLSAWLKTSKGGNKFMSLSVQAKDAQKPAPKADAAYAKSTGREPPKSNFEDDDIPF